MRVLRMGRTRGGFEGAIVYFLARITTSAKQEVAHHPSEGCGYHRTGVLGVFLEFNTPKLGG